MVRAAEGKKSLVKNRKARHDYDIEATWDAGLVLLGSEVKSLRESHATIADAFVEARGGELWLMNAKIEPYPWANQFNHEPTRPRKLLLHKAEIRRIAARLQTGGLALVPLDVYLDQGKIKVELGLGKGRRQFEKRDEKRAQEARREIESAQSHRRVGKGSS
jgi:SsrA-binding protein